MNAMEFVIAHYQYAFVGSAVVGGVGGNRKFDSWPSPNKVGKRGFPLSLCQALATALMLRAYHGKSPRMSFVAGALAISVDLIGPKFPGCGQGQFAAPPTCLTPMLSNQNAM